MEELPTELLVLIFEYSTASPRDYASWSRVSKLFRGIAKNNCYRLMTKSLFLFSDRNKELARQKDEKTRELEKTQLLLKSREKDLFNNREALNKKTLENTRLYEENQSLAKNQSDPSGYVRMSFNY